MREKKKKNYDTHTHFTQTRCIPGRLNMLRHFSELIWRGGAFRRGPPQWFWQSRHEKHYAPWGCDLPATSKQAVRPTLVIVHSPDKILVGEKVCKFISMLLHLNDFVAQRDTITYCNCESLKRGIIRCYLSVDTFRRMLLSGCESLCSWERQWAGRCKATCSQMFHVAKAICAAELRQEDGSHQNRSVPFRLDSACLYHTCPLLWNCYQWVVARLFRRV